MTSSPSALSPDGVLYNAPMRRTDLSLAEARRIALAAQGFADARPAGRVDIRHLRAVLARVGLLQIDTVNVLVRSHYLPLFSRLGPYPTSLLDDAAYQRKELFETWAHEASLIPIDHYPLLRHRMDAKTGHERFRRWVRDNSAYVEGVLDEVRERGPLAASDLSEPGTRRGLWWARSKGKMALEWHFRKGHVMVHGRRNFARVYDITERVIPAHVLDGDGPGEREAQRELLLLAARSHGVGTAHDLADYYRLAIPRCRELLAELTAEEALQEVSVEGWAEPAYLHPGARLPRSVEAQALLSPFDSLIWERSRTERLFDFRYRIEIYVPEQQRTFGYYVVPFLLGDRLVARVDLKADRAKRRLLVRAAHVEPSVDRVRVAAALAEELRTMAGWLELEDVNVARRGAFASELSRAMRG